MRKLDALELQIILDALFSYGTDIERDIDSAVARRMTGLESEHRNRLQLLRDATAKMEAVEPVDA